MFLFLPYENTIDVPLSRILKEELHCPSPAGDVAAPTGANLYARFALAGAVCCGVTHGAM
ncbi:unnamed protein product [Mucor hiemalis]